MWQIADNIKNCGIVEFSESRRTHIQKLSRALAVTGTEVSCAISGRVRVKGCGDFGRDGEFSSEPSHSEYSTASYAPLRTFLRDFACELGGILGQIPIAWCQISVSAMPEHARASQFGCGWECVRGFHDNDTGEAVAKQKELTQSVSGSGA